MHKRHLILLTFLLLVGGWRAQGQNITAAGSSCTTAGACAVIQLSTTNTGSVTFTISGTFSATLQFEVLADGTEANKSSVNCVPPNSTTAVTSTTAAGTWTCNVPGAQVFRVRCSAYTSGTAVVALNASNAIDTALLGGGGGGGGSGTVTSVTFTGDGTVLSATPSTAVTTSGTLQAALATQTANTVLGALTATTPSDLPLPSCSATTSALIWTSGTGFGCHTITPGTGTVTNVSGTGLLSTTNPTTTPVVACATCVGTGQGNTYTTGAQDFTGATSLLTTTQAASDASTKAASTQYVTTAITNAIAAVNPAVAVLAASTANITGTYTSVAGGIGDTFTVTATGAFTLDGIAINTIGQRVLLKNQTDATQNGIYTATIVGNVAVSPVFTRALDYDQPSDVNNTGAIPVQSGTANATTSWLLTSSITSIGPAGSAFTYAQFSVNPSNVVTAASPGVGLCHFAGLTQACTSSAVVAADITNATITGTQLSSTIALPNGATATTQSVADNTTKIATDAFVIANAGTGIASALMGGSTSAITWSTTNNSHNAFGGPQASNTTAAAIESVAARAFTVTAIRWNLSAAQASATVNLTFTLVDATASTSTQCQVTTSVSTTTTCTATGLSFSVAAGDLYYVEFAIGGGTGTSASLNWGILYQ
jgi:hypothetical protein